MAVSRRVAELLGRTPHTAGAAAAQARAFTTAMPSDISRHNVGVLAMDAYIPSEFVAQEQLEGVYGARGRSGWSPCAANGSARTCPPHTRRVLRREQGQVH